MNRREFIGGAVSAAAFLAARRSCAWCTWEHGHTRSKLPAGVDRDPLVSFQLPYDDPRRRQNQFIPAAPADANRFTFGSDGSFTFFHLSDMHEELAKIGDRERVFFAKMCEKFRPSLAILTGDNVNHRCKGLFEEAAGTVVRLFTDEKVPFAVTFGNHDTEVIGEGWYTAAEQWRFYRETGGRYFVDRRAPSVIGGGVSKIDVLDAGGKAGFNMCMLDSGDYGPADNPPVVTNVPAPEGSWPSAFDSVRSPQVAWARRTLAGGVPSLFFQHIVVPEIRDRMGRGLFIPVDEGDKTGVRLDYFGQRPVKVNPRRGKGVLGEGLGSVTVEKSRHPIYLDGGESIYEVWRGAENFRGAYFGHDHKNYFDGTTDEGVRLGITKTMSRCAYNDGDLGLRVFRIMRDGTYFTDVFTEKHPHGCSAAV
ncbi:MAG: metallophosphoesterase [Kiritimatiellae bacterium]|nr:metallophosphoesterase [Kiritimatiellia bacterium]